MYIYDSYSKVFELQDDSCNPGFANAPISTILNDLRPDIVLRSRTSLVIESRLTWYHSTDRNLWSIKSSDSSRTTDPNWSLRTRVTILFLSMVLWLFHLILRMAAYHRSLLRSHGHTTRIPSFVFNVDNEANIHEGPKVSGIIAMRPTSKRCVQSRTSLPRNWFCDREQDEGAFSASVSPFRSKSDYHVLPNFVSRTRIVQTWLSNIFYTQVPRFRCIPIWTPASCVHGIPFSYTEVACQRKQSRLTRTLRNRVKIRTTGVEPISNISHQRSKQKQVPRSFLVLPFPMVCLGIF